MAATPSAASEDRHIRPDVTSWTQAVPVMSSKSDAKAAAVRGQQRKGRKKEAAVVFYDCPACGDRFYSSTSLQKHQQLVHRQQRQAVKEPRDPSARTNGQYFDPNDPNDVQFFSSIHQTIANNLLHHVDGKLRSHPKKRSLVPDPPQPSSSSLDLSVYNFATPSSQQNAIHHSLPTGLLPRDFKRTSPTRTSNSKNCSLNFVCSVCGEKFACRSEFSGHAENNHPNVSYSDFRLEIEDDLPSRQHWWRYNSPNGLLGQCDVVSYPSDPDPRLSCTKCGHCFQSTEMLHQHVLQCAHTPHEPDCSSSSRTRSGKRRSLQKPPDKASNSHINKRKKQSETQQAGYSLPLSHGHDSNNNDSGPKNETNILKCQSCEQKFPLPESLNNHLMSCPMRQPSPAGIGEIIASKCTSGSQLDAAGVPKEQAASMRHACRSNASKSDDARRGSISGITSDECDAEDETGGHVCPDCGKRFAYTANFKKHRSKKCSASAKKADVKAASVCQQSGNDVSEESCRASESTAGDETEVELELEGKEDDERVSASLAAGGAETQCSQEGHLSYVFKGSPLQHHTCPYCKRGFTYLANYTKHVKQICPVRQQIGAHKRTMLGVCDSTADSENSALNSNESGQEHMCNVCHKSYNSLVELMKHRLSHKLTDNTTGADEDIVPKRRSSTVAAAVSDNHISSSSTRGRLSDSQLNADHSPADKKKEAEGSGARTKRISSDRGRELRSAAIKKKQE